MFRVGFEEEMQMRLEEERERIYRRQQEVKRRHEEGMNKLNQTLTHRMMRQGLTGLQEYEEEEELPPLEAVETEEELIPADSDDLAETEVPPPSRKHKETITYNTNMAYWKGKDVSLDDLKFQLYIRGVELTDTQKQEMDNLKPKGKGEKIHEKGLFIRNSGEYDKR